MPKKQRKPLTKEQQEDAARLRGFWDRRPAPQISQEDFAGTLGWTQGAVEQYLNGRVPLNFEAVGRFAKGLSRRISDISPSLAARLVELYQIEMPPGADLPKNEVTLLYEKLSSAEQREIMKRLWAAAFANAVSANGLGRSPRVLDDREVEKILTRKRKTTKGQHR